MLSLIVEPNVYGANLWAVFQGMCLDDFGACGGWFKAKMKLALIPNMMDLWRDSMNTQS